MARDSLFQYGDTMKDLESSDSTAAIIRAREILGSMKERRECFSDAVRAANQTHQQPSRPVVESTEGFYNSIRREDSRSIALKLKQTLKERKERLRRILEGAEPHQPREQRKRRPAPQAKAKPEGDVSPADEVPLSGPDLYPTKSESSKPPTLDDIRLAFSTPTDITEESTAITRMTGLHVNLLLDKYTPSDGTTSVFTSPMECTESIDNVAPELEHTGFSDSSSSHQSYHLSEMSLPEVHRGLRRAYSFETTLASEKKTDPSIRMKFSFDSLFFAHADRIPRDYETPLDDVEHELEPIDDVVESQRPASYHESPFRPRHEGASDATTGPNEGGLRKVCSYDESLISSRESPISNWESPLARKSCSFDISTGDPSCKLSLNELSPIRKNDMDFITPSFIDKGEKPSERPNSPLSSASSLTTKEERAVYVATLYQPWRGLRLPLRSDVQPEAEKPSSNTGEILGISMVKDHDERRVILESLSSDDDGSDGDGKGSLASPLTVSVSELSALISDASSFESAGDTASSGWMSGCEAAKRKTMLHVGPDDDISEVSMLFSAQPCPTADSSDDLILGADEFVAQKQAPDSPNKPPKQEVAPKTKRVAFAEEPKRKIKLATKRRKPKPALLILTEEVADSLAQSNSSLYAIAVASGLDLDKPLEIRVIPSKRPATKFLRLSPDFRCGAQGSMYDIAQRSGFDLKTPWNWRKKPKFLVARGGLFDMAMRSGLTTELMHSRKPYVVKTRPLYLTRSDYAEVLPEDVTDYECGAMGSLYLAFESSGGDYESKGSLYYLAARSGMKLTTLSKV